VHALTQNARGLPAVLRDAGVLQDQVGYDANGNVLAITDQQEGLASRSMAYDGLDRLTVANAPALWGTGSYGYDPLGNLRTSTVGSRQAVHTYWNNRLDRITTGDGVTAYVYDAHGNVTARGTQGFYFDQGNRLTLANGVESYTYDGHGRRTGISGQDGSQRTQVYASDGQLLYATRQQGTGSEATRTVYLAGKPLAEVSSTSGTTYLHLDLLGSVVATTGRVPAALKFTCPAGYTLSERNCTQATSSTVPATVSGTTCPAGYALSGSTCTKTTSTSAPATPVYGCAAGWTLAGTSCSSTSAAPATPVYGCPGGFTLAGTTCAGSTTGPATTTWDCKGQGTLQAFPSSPSGYYCTAHKVSVAAYNAGDYRGEVCQVKADSWGLPYVGHRPNGTQFVDCLIGPVAVYSCPAGAALSGSTCTAPTSQPASVTGYACAAGTLSGSSCLVTTTAPASVSYTCAPGQTLSGSTCTTTSTTTTAGTPVYSCPANHTLSGTNCIAHGTSTVAATASFACASGTVSGGFCEGAVTRTRYEPYGKVASGRVPSGLGFTGHVNDAGTGLVYMQQRYYDPIAGRFLSVDPITTDANTGKGFNLYEYAYSNPYRYVDPDGRDAWYKEPQQSATSSMPVLTLPTRTITAPRLTTPAVPVAGGGTLLLRGGVGLGLLTYSKPLGAPSEMCGVLACGGIRSEGATNVPPVPDVLVGDQSDPRAGPNKGGTRHTSGPLRPELGGAGDFQTDLDKLTGGTRPAQPGDKAPPGVW